MLWSRSKTIAFIFVVLICIHISQFYKYETDNAETIYLIQDEILVWQQVMLKWIENNIEQIVLNIIVWLLSQKFFIYPIQVHLGFQTMSIGNMAFWRHRVLCHIG